MSVYAHDGTRQTCGRPARHHKTAAAGDANSQIEG